MKLKKIFLGLIIISINTVLFAQAPKQETTTSNYDEVVNFFSGKWEGKGKFASGKDIAAEVVFQSSLDGKWLSYEHTDKLPNRFKSVSMWGSDATTGKLVAYMFDNSNGHRKFESEGWRNNQLILITQEQIPDKGTIYQHFIYEKLSDKQFKMTFEVSKDGENWRMVDYVIFDKK